MDIENVKTVDRARMRSARWLRRVASTATVRIDRAEELERAMTAEMARRFTAIFKGLGFHYVT